MKRTAGASGERVKVDRRMAVRTGTDRFVKILLEVPSARIEDAQLKISCVGRRHSIDRLIGLEMEWPLSTTLPLRPHPSARPELPDGFPPAAARPVSLLKSVLRRRRC